MYQTTNVHVRMLIVKWNRYHQVKFKVMCKLKCKCAKNLQNYTECNQYTPPRRHSKTFQECAQVQFQSECARFSVRRSTYIANMLKYVFCWVELDYSYAMNVSQHTHSYTWYLVVDASCHFLLYVCLAA